MTYYNQETLDFLNPIIKFDSARLAFSENGIMIQRCEPGSVSDSHFINVTIQYQHDGFGYKISGNKVNVDYVLNPITDPEKLQKIEPSCIEYRKKWPWSPRWRPYVPPGPVVYKPLVKESVYRTNNLVIKM